MTGGARTARQAATGQHKARHACRLMIASQCAQAQAKGQTMAAFDSLIAATAVEHGLALATRNVADFGAAPVVLVNPWESTAG